MLSVLLARIQQAMMTLWLWNLMQHIKNHWSSPPMMIWLHRSQLILAVIELLIVNRILFWADLLCIYKKNLNSSKSFLLDSHFAVTIIFIYCILLMHLLMYFWLDLLFFCFKRRDSLFRTRTLSHSCLWWGSRFLCQQTVWSLFYWFQSVSSFHRNQENDW